MASTQLTYVGEAPIDLYRPAGDPRSLQVEPGDVVETPGGLLEETGDAYVTGTPEDPRAWPKASWSLGGKTTAAPPAAAKKTSTASADTASAEQKES